MNEKEMVVEQQEEDVPQSEVVELSLDQLANIGGGASASPY